MQSYSNLTSTTFNFVLSEVGTPSPTSPFSSSAMAGFTGLLATTNPTTIGTQSASVIEDTTSSSAFIQLSAPVGKRLDFLDPSLISAGWIKVGTSSVYTHTGLYGMAYLDTSTGKVSYELDNSLAATTALAGGKIVKDNFTIPDSIGGVKYSTAVSFSITGSNDAAVIGGVNTGALIETDLVQSVTGMLSITDVDSAATFVAQTNVNGSNAYGKFSITTAGAWTYTMSTAHNEFKAGVDYTDSITVKSADGTPKVITVTIKGADDLAVIGGVNTATLTETNAALTATGLLTATDVDSTASFVGQTGVEGSNHYGKFSVTTAGVWTYTMNNAHDEFKAGTSYTDSVTVKTTDGASKVVTVTMNGTNDVAVITGTTSASLTVLPSR